MPEAARVKKAAKYTAPVPLSEQAKKNRERALNINRGFVLFLSLIMVAIMVVCIRYIRLRAQYTALISTVASLESDLTKIKEDNDAYYSQVTSNLDLSRVRKIAISRLGMKYPTENQIESYTIAEGSGYVRQYQDLPDE